MAMFPNPPDERENTAGRTETGAEGVLFVPGDLEEVHLALPSCRSCHHRTAHGSPCHQIGIVPELGSSRVQGMPEANLVTTDLLQKIQTMLFAMGHVFVGTPYQNFLYNLGLGTANNVTQQSGYRIVGTSGGLQLYGPNPARIFSPRSVINASWPLPAENEQRPPYLTDEQWEVMRWGRLISGGIITACRAGRLWCSRRRACWRGSCCRW